MPNEAQARDQDKAPSGPTAPQPKHKQQIETPKKAEGRLLVLEGDSTPDLIMRPDEKVLMDLSQGWRDLGLWAKIVGHKGRLIVTNRRVIYFKKKTKDYEIQQLGLSNTGFVTMGYSLQFVRFLIGLFLILGGIGSMIAAELVVGAIGMVIGGLIVFTSRIQGLRLAGSGGQIVFATKSIPHKELSRILTVVSAFN